MRLPWEKLPRFVSEALKGIPREGIYEIRLRLSQPIEVGLEGGYKLLGGSVSEEQMRLLIASLTGHSLYACESQMREGYFTIAGGARVGVAGRYTQSDEGLQSISSVSIRIPRDVAGDSDLALKYIVNDFSLASCLILSPPRMGKTTLLRALIRRLSGLGFHVGVADERDELAGGECLGSRVDVVANCPKRVAIPRMIRAMSPEVVATDEIGHPMDSGVIADAQRSGCAVIATAHARDVASASRRKTLSGIIDEGIFDVFIELGLRPGHISRVLSKGGNVLWTHGA